jgi:muconate cycloisomerase
VAHESLTTVDDAVLALRLELADIWAVTPGLHGGLVPARTIMALAQAHGLSCLIGSTVELGVATAALAHLAVATPVLDGHPVPSDIVGPLYHPEDVIRESFTVQSGRIFAPEGPGLGVTLDEARLRQFRLSE